MDRRSFLNAALASSLAASVSACREQARPSPPPAASAVPAFELEDLSVADLLQGLKEHRYSSARLVDLYRARIEALDRQGPALHHVLEVNPHARRDAEQLDRERKAGRLRGPLHGVPIVVKDNIDTAGPMRTTAGSLALEAAPAGRDAFIIERLRKAGAIILAKTNLSEWANFRSTRSSSGWSARGGQGRNPYVLDRSPCGSSSGAGGAVAASYAAAGIGTETDGSIVCPSSHCGLVGLKPTVGLVSRQGIIPISATQDTAGPMTRTVRDAALLLGAIAGAHAGDAATSDAGKHAAGDYTAFLDVHGLKGARIGVCRQGFTGYHTGVDRLFEQSLEAMRRMGAEIIDPADLPHLGEYDESELEVLLYEFKDGVNRYLATRTGLPVRTLTDLIAYNKQHQDREMPYFGQELFEQAEAKGPLTDRAYQAALAKNRRLTRNEGIDAVMKRHRLDALVAPTGGPAWLIDLVTGDHFLGSSSSPAAVAGYPAITVPAGLTSELPVGITFFGRAWSEPVLLRVAYSYEQATRLRRPPRFLPTLAIGQPDSPSIG